MSQQAQETVVVPREPTPEMIEAAHRATPVTFLMDADPTNIWLAMTRAAPVSADSDLLKEAVGLLRVFDKHLGEDDGFWTDNSTIRPEWFDEGVRRSLTFGMFRQVRTFLSKVGDATHG